MNKKKVLKELYENYINSEKKVNVLRVKIHNLREKEQKNFTKILAKDDLAYGIHYLDRGVK